MIKFLLGLLAALLWRRRCPDTIATMSSFDTLNDAITSATASIGQALTNTQAAQEAVNAAKARVANLPSGEIDLSSQAAAVASIGSQAATIAQLAQDTKNAADTIAPAP